MEIYSHTANTNVTTLFYLAESYLFFLPASAFLFLWSPFECQSEQALHSRVVGNRWHMSLKHQRVTRNGAHLDAKVINPDSSDRRKADVRLSVVFCQQREYYSLLTVYIILGDFPRYVMLIERDVSKQTVQCVDNSDVGKLVLVCQIWKLVSNNRFNSQFYPAKLLVPGKRYFKLHAPLGRQQAFHSKGVFIRLMVVQQETDLELRNWNQCNFWQIKIWYFGTQVENFYFIIDGAIWVENLKI